MFQKQVASYEKKIQASMSKFEKQETAFESKIQANIKASSAKIATMEKQMESSNSASNKKVQKYENDILVLQTKLDAAKEKVSTQVVSEQMKTEQELDKMRKRQQIATEGARDRAMMKGEVKQVEKEREKSHKNDRFQQYNSHMNTFGGLGQAGFSGDRAMTQEKKIQK